MQHRITALIAKAATKVVALLLAATLAAPLSVHAETPDVATQVMALQAVFPNGMPWTNETQVYTSAAWPFYGVGCTAFTMQVSDAVYGKNAKVNLLYGVTPADVQVGDVVRLNGNHSAMVISVSADAITVCEGNYNASVRWGRQISTTALATQLTYIARRG